MESRGDWLGVGGGAVSAAHSGALLVRSRVALRRSARNVLRVSNAAYFACAIWVRRPNDEIARTRFWHTELEVLRPIAGLSMRC